MNKMSISLDNYVARSIETVQGYLSALDAGLIAALLSYQNANNIVGDLCEVGVHHGRLFLILALARRAGDRALAIDLFEDDAMNANSQHSGRDRALSENARRLGIELSEEELFKTSSLDINATDILKRTTSRIRFFSVDGGHTYQHVENDLCLAERTLSAEGVIAVDDFFSINWADVSFATYDFLRRTDTLVPFAITSGKVYLAAPIVAERYKAALSKRADLGQIACSQVLGKEVITLRRTALRRGYDSLRGQIMRRIA